MKKIVILGPESTGKSTLCRQLASHYNTGWAEEYARDYLQTRGLDYTYEDLYEIASGQLNNELLVMSKMAASPSGPVFFDTDLYVIKVWSEFVFGRCDNRLLSQIALGRYDLYLLCDTDLPWEADALREYPDLGTRRKLFHYYKDAMIHQDTSWQIISGDYDQRFQMAVAAVDAIL